MMHLRWTSGSTQQVEGSQQVTLQCQGFGHGAFVASERRSMQGLRKLVAGEAQALLGEDSPDAEA